MPDDNEDEDLPAFIDISAEIERIWKQPLAERYTTESAKAISEATSAESTVGCFDFSDGTIQNWTLDQLYGWRKVPSTVPNAPPEWKRSKLAPFTEYLPYQGFVLTNSQKLALSAGISKLFVLDPDVLVAELIFQSPDLTASKGWVGATGFRIDLHRFYATSWFNIGNPAGGPPSYTAQLQLRVRRPNPSTGKIEEVTWAEYDAQAKQFIHHAIDHDKNYRLEFKPPELATQKGAEILSARVCCRFPGYLGKGNGESALGGAWLIGNVCPIP